MYKVQFFTFMLGVALLSMSSQANINKDTNMGKTKKVILMGFNPAENVDVVKVNSKAFSDYYKKKTGYSIKTFIATDYTALVEALRSGRIHFAWLPPFSYIKAEQMAGAEVLMKAVRKGRASFYSAIITRSDSSIKTVADLKGKNIAWVDPASTSGHIFPKASLMTKYNIDPDTYFKRQIFAGGHDSLVLAVLRGTVDAGATFANDPKGKTGSWHLFLKEKEDQGKIRVVYVTDPITGDTLTTSKKYRKENPKVVEEMVSILGEMGNNKKGKELLKSLYRIDAMVPAKSKDYDAVRKAAKILDIL